MPCPAGTYSDLPYATSAGACNSCPAGYQCDLPGVSSFTSFPCPVAYFCEQGQPPVPCPMGTASNVSRATSVTDCLQCPATMYCPSNATAIPTLLCPEGSYCPEGTAVPVPCSPGYHCAAESAQPLACPPNHYCANSSTPIVCPVGHYCSAATGTAFQIDNYAVGSVEARLCPAGYRDSVEGGGSHDRSTLAQACTKCEAGKYGSHPQRYWIELTPMTLTHDMSG